jgi:uracil-DNA glycosylase family 4
MSEIAQFYEEMKKCSLCKLRQTCTQVVPAIGNIDNPKLMVVGECPGEKEDEQGEPFVGKAGIALRQALRDTKIINQNNTVITNTVKCRPPNNKFPHKDISSICFSRWLKQEIALIKPKKMLLLGNVPLGHILGLSKITDCRGTWYNYEGIRTMATFHPSYICRQDTQGDMDTRDKWERDIMVVAEEIKKIGG